MSYPFSNFLLFFLDGYKISVFGWSSANYLIYLSGVPPISFLHQSTRWLLYTEQAPSAWLNFALCGLVGIITAYAFVWITQYYTDYKYEPVKTLALASSTGHGTNIIAGVALGLESTGLPVLVISVAIVSAYWLGQSSGLVDESGNPTGGLFGTAVATMGMLSTAAYVLTMDMFGPIADNAGGIVEMSQQVSVV